MNRKKIYLILAVLCLSISAFGFSPDSAEAKTKRIYVEIKDYYGSREYVKGDTYRYNKNGYKGTLKSCGRSSWWEWNGYVKYCGYAYKKI